MTCCRCAGSIVSLLLVSAVSISQDGLLGHQVVAERFLQSRAVLTASFVTGMWRMSPRANGLRRLLVVRADVSTEDFEQMVLAFGLDSAVLLDSQGRALEVSPADADMIGDQLGDRYAHLAAALEGRTGVSGVAPSATTSEPVVAVAVPFDTPSGRGAC